MAQTGVIPGSQAANAEKYLFYLHGKIIEDQGIPRPKSPKFGYYEYEKILSAFRRRGFTVRSEIRPENTEVRAYADKVAGEIKKLLLSKVPPGHITVVGASKGGVIAVSISALLQNRDINFVFLAGCYDATLRNFQDMNMQVAGNILSIYDAADDTGCGSCRNFFAMAQGKNLGRTREIVLHLGLGHGFLYRPLPEWVEPTVAWAGEN
ncbi:MAG TPA: alpha/beta hydrolase [Acidobacteriota bacterium]